jgi:hypothetical protein
MADLQHRENAAFTVIGACLGTPAKLDCVSSDTDTASAAQKVSQSGASGVHTAGSTSQELPKMNAALQIKNFPAELLAQLKAAAAIQRCTLSDYVTNVLRANFRNLQSPADAMAEAEPGAEPIIWPKPPVTPRRTIKTTSVSRRRAGRQSQ